MNNLALKHNPDENFLVELEECSKRAAAAFSPYLKNTDLEGYKHFLHYMYHYTLDSENKLRFAAKNSSSQELSDYFLHMAHEERGHYLLAQRDYEAFGLSINPDKTPKEVDEFNKFWYTLGSENCNEFVGALFVFEGIADQVGKDIFDMIDRLAITKKQSRWFRVHVEADEGHGAEAKSMCQKYGPAHPDAIIRAAKDAEQKWANVFTNAFKAF